MIASFFSVTLERIVGQNSRASTSYIVSVKKVDDGAVRIFDATKYFGDGEKARNRFNYVMNNSNIEFTTSETILMIYFFTFFVSVSEAEQQKTLKLTPA